MIPFYQDEDELIAQDPAIAGQLPINQPLPLPQQQAPIQQGPPPALQGLPPDFFNQQPIFDRPDFKRLQEIVNPRPSAYEQQRLADEEKDIRHRALYDNLSAIAAGGQPRSSVDVERLIAEKRDKQGSDKLNKYKALLDIYGNVQNSQNLDVDKRLKTYNSFLDTTPGSPKAQANLENFKTAIEHYKALARQNAAQIGQDPAETQAIISDLDSYKKNAGNLSYMAQEKLIADLDKRTNQSIGATRNTAMVQAGSTKSAAEAEAHRLAQLNNDRMFNLHMADMNHKWQNMDFDNQMKLQQLALEKEKSDKNSNKIKLSHDQNKLMGEISENEFKINKASALLDSIKELQSNPETAGSLSGWFTGGIKNPIKSMFNQTTNNKISDIAADLTRLFSVERKTFAGSNVTPSEIQQLAPMIPDLKSDSEKTIMSKLERVKEWLAEKQIKNYQQMQFDENGEQVDQSLVAQRAAAAAQEMAKSDNFIKKYYPQYFKNNQSASKPSSGIDPKIQDYANSHLNGDYQRARSILIGRGYTPNE